MAMCNHNHFFNYNFVNIDSHPDVSTPLESWNSPLQKRLRDDLTKMLPSSRKTQKTKNQAISSPIGSGNHDHFFNYNFANIDSHPDVRAPATDGHVSLAELRHHTLTRVKTSCFSIVELPFFDPRFFSFATLAGFSFATLAVSVSRP